SITKSLDRAYQEEWRAASGRGNVGLQSLGAVSEPIVGHEAAIERINALNQRGHIRSEEQALWFFAGTRILGGMKRLVKNSRSAIRPSQEPARRAAACALM